MFAPDEFFDIEDFLHRDLWKGEDAVWSALIALEEYMHFSTFRIEIHVPSTVHLIYPEQISIGKGTVLEPGVCIRGPCILGESCLISQGAFVRDGVICGNGCVIGHAAEVKRSILLDRARATHFTYVGDSILGKGVNLGAGVKCANVRLDRKEVSISIAEGRIRTGLRKMGAIVGDGTQVGCNCVLNPGTLIGKECKIRPLLSVGGVIMGQHVF